MPDRLTVFAPPLISASALASQPDKFTLVDCRFNLGEVDAGVAQYLAGHIPGAHYLHLERDLSGPVGKHGGRHPLPEPHLFCQRMAELGIARDTPVVAYDASRFAFAARFWWMLCSLGYEHVQLLDGGIQAWQQGGGELECEVPVAQAVEASTTTTWTDCLDIDGVRMAQERGALLVDAREPKRYQGLEEPIDPIAGHIPGAINLPWQDVTSAEGMAQPGEEQVRRWSLLEQDRELVVYCGSGVTACVNLLSLELAGRRGARLYAGSWSDWCSFMPDPHN